MKDKLHRIIFESDTKAGKLFDIVLIWMILLSVFVVCLESVSEINFKYSSQLVFIEWALTGIFSIEYVLRLYTTSKTKSYAFSFFGIIDLLALLPMFVGLFITGAGSLVVIRSIRILRIFRLLKLSRFVGEAEVLKKALASSKHKIIVFLLSVVTIVIFMGAMMYLIEGRESGFDSIPKSMYWAIVTMTTVGYGDLVPQTNLGKLLASVLMIMGYAIIAVPTGIVTSELTSAKQNENKKQCLHCDKPLENQDYKFCPYCSKEIC